MFEWQSCAASAASLMNICDQLGPVLQVDVSIVLMTMRFSNPCAPLIFARHTSAIPPAARRDSISYLLNSVPGSQGDGSAARRGRGFQARRRRGRLARPAPARARRAKTHLYSLSSGPRPGWAINGVRAQNLTAPRKSEGWMTIRFWQSVIGTAATRLQAR